MKENKQTQCSDIICLEFLEFCSPPRAGAAQGHLPAFTPPYNKYEAKKDEKLFPTNICLCYKIKCGESGYDLLDINTASILEEMESVLIL